MQLEEKIVCSSKFGDDNKGRVLVQRDNRTEKFHFQFKKGFRILVLRLREGIS